MPQLLQPPNNITLTANNQTSPIWARWFLSLYTEITKPDISSVRVSVGSNQSIATATATKVAFDTESYDVNSKFDATTNYRYQPGIEGIYTIRAQVLWNTSAADYTHTLQIYKNGSPVSTDIKRMTFVAGTYTQTILDSISLLATDYIEIYATQDSGGNLNINSGTASSYLIASQQR